MQSVCHPTPRRKRRNAFTLVELLVVIGIIAVLISILLPGLQRAREAANGLKCQSNCRQLMLAFLQWSMDHKGQLPGTIYSFSYTPTNPDHADWLYGTMPNSNAPGNFNTCPQTGTIYPYMKNPDSYRCPSADSERYGAEGGSNGKFDYAFFAIFAGAKVSNIPNEAILTNLQGKPYPMPTPIICHEDSYQFNGANIEGDHGNVDQITHMHFHGGYYAAIDGSAQFVIEPDVLNVWSNGCWQWAAKTPHAQMLALGNASSGDPWEWWDTQ